MPRRGFRKKTKQYVLDRFQEDDPEAFFKYKASSGQGMSQDEWEFVQAVECCAVQCVISLLNRGLEPNYTVDRSNRTPLHLAVANCKPGSDPAAEKIIGLMLYFGADPNAVTCEGHSALHLACTRDNWTVVEKLISAGADPDLADDSNETPLMKLCSHVGTDSPRIMDLLLTAGAAVSCYNTLGQTALHLLTCCPRCSVQRSQLAHILLRRGLSASETDSSCNCPMTYELSTYEKMKGPSSSTDGLPLIETLVQAGASLPWKYFLSSSHQNRAVLPSDNYMSLRDLISTLHPIMPQQELRDIQQYVSSHRHSNLPQVKAIGSEVESSLCRVMSLGQLCRLQVRSSLGGKIFWAVEFLPIPLRMKEFLMFV